MAVPPWRPVDGGLALVVRLTPRGGRDALGAVEVLADGKSVLTARVRAAPTDGEANDALVRLVAATLGRPASAVRLTAGASARVKTLTVSGDADDLARRLAALTAAG